MSNEQSYGLDCGGGLGHGEEESHMGISSTYKPC